MRAVSRIRCDAVPAATASLRLIARGGESGLAPMAFVALPAATGGLLEAPVV